MRTIENFTTASPGSRVPLDGEIALCPSCGRAGIVEYLADHVTQFVHVESEEVMADGMLIEPLDRCELPS